MQHTDPEETEHGDKSYDHEEYHMFHRDIHLPAHRFALLLAALELTDCQTGGLRYDWP